MDLLNKNDLPEGFEYPQEFLKVCNLGLTDLEPWSIMMGDYLKKRYEVFIENNNYKHKLLPFARRLDNDDLACWDLTLNKIVVVHDYTQEGWERKRYFDNFWDWFRFAIEGMIHW